MTIHMQDHTSVIAGVSVAPGEVKCGVRGGASVVALLGKLTPYLDPNVAIPSCPVRGKPEPIDLSDMEI